jgi:hypothetical protein
MCFDAKSISMGLIVKIRWHALKSLAPVTKEAFLFSLKSRMPVFL